MWYSVRKEWVLGHLCFSPIYTFFICMLIDAPGAFLILIAALIVALMFFQGLKYFDDLEYED
jgi:hypothetical protein